MDITGKIITVLPTRSGVSSKSGKSWASQDAVIEIPGQYPRHILFTIFGEDHIKQFNLYPNAEVTVQFDIDAHEYQGRWYNDIRAYNVIHVSSQSSSSTSPSTAASPAPSATVPAGSPAGLSSPSGRVGGVFAATPPPSPAPVSDDLPF